MPVQKDVMNILHMYRLTPSDLFCNIITSLHLFMSQKFCQRAKVTLFYSLSKKNLIIL